MSSRLITLLAREIRAQFAFYSQITGSKLCAVAEWHVDHHLDECVRCNCAACAEVLNYAAGHLLYARATRGNPLADPITLRVTETHPRAP